MASVNDISVAVELAVHRGFAEMAVRIYEEHGVQVRNVSFEWLGHIVTDVHTTTSYQPGGKIGEA